jgi:hypothetical protein
LSWPATSETSGSGKPLAGASGGLFEEFGVRQFHLVDLRHRKKDFAGWSINKKIQFTDELQHVANESSSGVTTFLREETYQRHYLAGLAAEGAGIRNTHPVPSLYGNHDRDKMGDHDRVGRRAGSTAPIVLRFLPAPSFAQSLTVYDGQKGRQRIGSMVDPGGDGATAGDAEQS